MEVQPREGRSDIEMLEFSLPIPADRQEKLRALTYLHDTIDYYIQDFCGKSANVDRAFNAAANRRGGRIQVDPNVVSLPQAIQVFLCFSILMFI